MRASLITLTALSPPGRTARFSRNVPAGHSATILCATSSSGAVSCAGRFWGKFKNCVHRAASILMNAFPLQTGLFHRVSCLVLIIQSNHCRNAGNMTEGPIIPDNAQKELAPADPLSAVLNQVKLRAEVICASEFSAPFGIAFPAGPSHFQLWKAARSG